jgi:curved DNA-binding protein CbpA
MSSPAAGKFQDHYEVLGIDPLAGEDAVREAYERLAKQHAHDPRKLESLQLALEVLTDAELRASFNKLKGIEDPRSIAFSGTAFFEGLNREVGLRVAVLCVLYDRRKSDTYATGLTARQLEGLLETTYEDLSFTLWYLKQRNLVTADDKSRLQITVAGIDFVDQERPKPEQVMRFIKGARKPAPAAHLIEVLREGGQDQAVA